jgi:hypothetical protein
MGVARAKNEAAGLPFVEDFGGLGEWTAGNDHWSVSHGCHPERSEGPLKAQERSLAALGMTAGL